jgi:hypothetical protein
VDRNAPWATVRFSWPAGDVRAPAAWAGLPGVRDVRRTGHTVEVNGDRAMVFYLAADLVQRGRVPADLAVLMPDLEAALISLLA